MYKNVLQHTDNIALWPAMSFVIFFAFFLCLIWYVAKADKKFIAKMKDLPLENTTPGRVASVEKNKSDRK